MTNICSARFKKNLDPDQVATSLRNIAKKRFDDTIIIHSSSPLHPVKIQIRENRQFYAHLYINNQKLEWKHQLDQVMWWVVSYLMSKLLRELDPRVKITDDGLDKKVKPDFDVNYPTPVHWIMAIENALPIDRKVEQVFYQAYETMLPKFWKIAMNG